MRQIADGTYYRNGMQATPTTGYAVGLEEGDAFATHYEDRSLFMFLAVLEKYPKANYVGVWTEKLGMSKNNPKGTKIVFDPIEIYQNLEVALRVAKRNNQKAIWDFSTGQEIPLFFK